MVGETDTKSRWPALTGRWVEPDVRDEVVDYVRAKHERTEIPAKKLVAWLGIGMSKFYDWQERYGKVNEHNAHVPRDHWLEAWEREAILAFDAVHPLEGYRRLTYLMLDADLVAASPTTVYRALQDAGRFDRWNRRESLKGSGFVQPLAADVPHAGSAVNESPACRLAGYEKSVSAGRASLPGPACTMDGFEAAAARLTCRATVSRWIPSRRAIARCDQPCACNDSID